jgi:hypothetical protein
VILEVRKQLFDLEHKDPGEEIWTVDGLLPA